MNDGVRYHHGDLRRALLEAARDTIRTGGAENLTLRGVARAANVSHAAPYHHFPDKDALLAAVAKEGFDALSASVDARAAAAESPGLALQEAAIGYVGFAVRHPALFRVMFGPHLADRTAYPALAEAAQAAFDTVERGLAGLGPGKSHSTHELAMASWSLPHGVAMLMIDGQIAVASPEEAESLARRLTDVFWLGLSRVAADPAPDGP